MKRGKRLSTFRDRALRRSGRSRLGARRRLGWRADSARHQPPGRGQAGNRRVPGRQVRGQRDERRLSLRHPGPRVDRRARRRQPHLPDHHHDHRGRSALRARLHWAALSGRSTTWTFCRPAPGIALVSSNERHSFFGQHDHTVYSCSSPGSSRPDSGGEARLSRSAAPRKAWEIGEMRMLGRGTIQVGDSQRSGASRAQLAHHPWRQQRCTRRSTGGSTPPTRYRPRRHAQPHRPFDLRRQRPLPRRFHPAAALAEAEALNSP